MATWSDEDIAAIKAAIASSVLTVSYSGPPSRTITYQNVKDLKATLKEMLSDNARAAGGKSYRLASTRKGF